GLLKDRFAPGGFFGEQPMGVAELGPIAAHWLLVTHDAPQVHIDHEGCLAAGTCDVEFGFELHGVRRPPARRTYVPRLLPLHSSQTAAPLSSVAVTSILKTDCPLLSNRWPNAVSNLESGAVSVCPGTSDCEPPRK